MEDKHKAAKSDSLQTHLEKKVNNIFVPLESVIRKQLTTGVINY